MALEKDTLKVKCGNGVDAWNLLPYAFSFITIADANETTRGLSEEATDAETQAGTAVGGTGAKLFITPAKLIKTLIRSVSIPNGASGTTNIDCLLSSQLKVLFTVPVTGNITITRSNDANLETLNIMLSVTGASISITFPSDVRMDRIFEGGVWNQTTKVLTLSSVGTADIFELSLMKAGSVFILRYGGPARA
jgi:hypothetical protein